MKKTISVLCAITLIFTCLSGIGFSTSAVAQNQDNPIYEKLAPVIEKINEVKNPSDIKKTFEKYSPPSDECEIIRFEGETRYDTANLISSDELWEDGSDIVFLASGTNFPDALAGGPIARILSAPILLTSGKGQLEDSVRARIDSLDPQLIIILGGVNAVNPSVVDSLKDKYTAERIAGDDRFQTAGLIAVMIDYYVTIYYNNITNPPENIMELFETYESSIDYSYIVNGYNFPDALSIAPIAAMEWAPILFANKPGDKNLNEVTEELLSDHLTSLEDTTIIGGQSAVSQSIETQISNVAVCDVFRIGGETRFETSAEIFKVYNEWEYFDSCVGIATGRNFPDALAGGVLLAYYDAPILLVENSVVHDCIKDAIDELDPNKAYVFGGKTVISDETVNNYFPQKLL